MLFRSKYTNELYAKVFSDLYGIETIGLRYFNVFGRRQDPAGAYAAAIPKFIKLLIAGDSPVIFGDGSQTRDFTYIENVIQANQLAALVEDKNALNTVYNIAYGESVTVSVLVDYLKEILADYNPSINNIQPKYQPERVGEVQHSLASIERAKQYLGYQRTHNLKEGLIDAAEGYWKNLR